jgi:hypothetical protein
VPALKLLWIYLRERTQLTLIAIGTIAVGLLYAFTRQRNPAAEIKTDVRIAKLEARRETVQAQAEIERKIAGQKDDELRAELAAARKVSDQAERRRLMVALSEKVRREP